MLLQKICTADDAVLEMYISWTVSTFGQALGSMQNHLPRILASKTRVTHLNPNLKWFEPFDPQKTVQLSKPPARPRTTGNPAVALHRTSRWYVETIAQSNWANNLALKKWASVSSNRFSVHWRRPAECVPESERRRSPEAQLAPERAPVPQR